MSRLDYRGAREGVKRIDRRLRHWQDGLDQGGDRGGGKKWMDGKIHIWKEELKSLDMRWEGKRNQVPLPDFGLEKLDKWLCYY